MSTSRLSADTALLVCSVVRTRWPVRDARMRQLGGLGVADLADQDDVGVLAQHRAQAAAKVRPLRSLICTWVRPGSWISTGSSSVTMLRSGVVDLVQRREEGAGLAEPVGPVMQHEALWGLQQRRRRSASWSGSRPTSVERLQPLGAARAAG